MHEGQRLVKCLGPVLRAATPGSRPVYGKPCGYAAIAPRGCCSGSRYVPDPGKTGRPA